MRSWTSLKSNATWTRNTGLWEGPSFAHLPTCSRLRAAPKARAMTSVLTLIALAFGLSVDAFAAALGRGAGGGERHFGQALKVGAVFGGMEAVMPLVGYIIGLLLATSLAPYDHWIAFTLLAAVGAHMIREAFKEDDGDADEEGAAEPSRRGRLTVLLTAAGTSIDANIVGVSLAMMGANILLASAIIFVVTTTLCTLGVLIGRAAAGWLGRWAEIAGGLTLIAIGVIILNEHLSNGI